MGNQCCDGREEVKEINTYDISTAKQGRRQPFDHFENINSQNKNFNEDSLHGANFDNQNSFGNLNHHDIFGNTQLQQNRQNRIDFEYKEEFPSGVQNQQNKLARKDSPFSIFQSEFKQKVAEPQSDQHIINAESFRKVDQNENPNEFNNNFKAKTSNIFLQDDDLNQLQQITQSQFQYNNFTDSNVKDSYQYKPETDYNTNRGQIRMSNFEQLPNDSMTQHNQETDNLERIDESFEPKNNIEDSAIETYTGEKLNGKPHGKGKVVFKNGDIYEGELYTGQMQGYGKLEKPSEYIYEGYFMDNQFNGKGKKIYQDGRIHEGEFRNGKEQGVGVLTGPDQKVISRGIWINGVLQG